MAASRTHRIAEVAALMLAGVTVRTLHHYDEIGLLVPSARSRAGHRLYTEQDLLRLQQSLIQRELGLPLEQICHMLDDEAFDLRARVLPSFWSRRSARTRRTSIDVRSASVASRTGRLPFSGSLPSTSVRQPKLMVLAP